MKYLLVKNKPVKPPEGTVIRLLKAGLLGFVLGFLLALWSARSVWLEMRFNIGTIIPATVLGCMLLSFCKRVRIRYSIFLFLQVIWVVVFFLIYPFETDALATIPACLLREGCLLAFVSLSWINLVLALILLAGNIIWMVQDRIDGPTRGE